MTDLNASINGIGRLTKDDLEPKASVSFVCPNCGNKTKVGINAEWDGAFITCDFADDYEVSCRHCGAVFLIDDPEN